MDDYTFKDELRDAFAIADEELDIDFLVELLHFFPIDKTYIAAGSYDQYLYDLEKTVIDNYRSGNYQVSFFYAHLIFMSYVYYSVERAYSVESEKVKDIYALINQYSGGEKPNINNYASIYDFSKIPEKEIYKVFYAIGMDVQFIQQLSAYTKDRDNYAHATGKGNISETSLMENIKAINNNMENIHKLFNGNIKSLYIDFLLKSVSYDYDAFFSAICDFIDCNDFSIKDIEFLCNLGISNIRNENQLFLENYRFIKKEHCAFIEYCRDNYGIAEPATYGDLRDDNFLYYRYQNKAREYVEDELGISEYGCVRDGKEFPIYECPECEQPELVHDSSARKYHCFSCETDFDEGEIVFCCDCGRPIISKDDCIQCRECLERLTESD